jgi:hypothetical protein
MKKNLLFLLSLVVCGAPISAMKDDSEDALKVTKEQQSSSKSYYLKQFANLGLVIGFGAFSARLKYDQLLEEEWATFVSRSPESRKACLTRAKNCRNLAVISGLTAGFFFYNALSNFIGKKLSIKIVNNDESK